MRRYFIFATAALGILMYSTDATAVAVAFPSFIKELGSNILWSGWTISIYYIGVTMTTPIAGNLSDTLGRKKVFLISLALFTLSSLACGLAPNIYVLVACRLLQGMGGASFLPTASGIVSDHSPESRATAIGLFSSIFNIGNIIGPNLGGWIVSRFSWRYIFYINLPIGLLLTGMILLLLKDSKVSSQSRVDLGGALLLAGTLLFIMFGLNVIGDSLSVPAALLAALFVTSGLCLAILFLRHEKGTSQPIIDLSLLRSRPFLASNLLNTVMGAGFFGLYAFMPLYVTSVHKLSTLMSGVIMTPRSIGLIPASVVTSFLLRRWGYRRPIAWGLSTAGCAVVLLTPGFPFWGMCAANLGTIGLLSVLILASGVGAGIANPGANNACIELMPEKVATIMGLRGMFRTIGGAAGIFIITFILHLSSSPVTGFKITFISFGLALLFAIPLVLMVPDGRSEGT